MNFPDLRGIISPEFWVRLYSTGQLTADGDMNLLLVIVVRLAIIALLILAASITVGVMRKLVAHGIAAAMTRAGQGQRRLITLQGLLTSTLTYVIYFIAFILILFVFGLTWKGLAPFFAVATVLPLAVGFGAQRLIRDVITGLFILGEGQFDVGDLVTIGGVTGRVEDMGVRVTRVRDDQGRLYIIANGDITQVFNASRGPVRLAIDLQLAPTTTLETTVPLILQAAEDALGHFEITPSESHHPVVSVVGMTADRTTVRLVLWTPNSDKGAVEDRIRRQLLQDAAQQDTEFKFAPSMVDSRP